MFKRGGVWWTCIRNKGKRYQQSLGTSNKKLARDLESKFRAEILEGEHDNELGKDKSFGEMMERFLDEHSPLVAPRTVESYKGNLKHLEKVFDGMLVSDISPRDIHGYKVKRRKEKASTATINRELSLLSVAFNIAIRNWEWNLDNPVSKVGLDKENNERDRWLTKQEATRLMKHCEPLLRHIVTFALNTGMRQGEILSLEWSAVDMARRTAVVMKSKNGRRRTLPLSDSAFSVLKERAKVRHIHNQFVFTNGSGGKVDRSKMTRKFGKAVKQANIMDFRFHDLRHTAATWLAQAGHDIYFIARWLGHQDIKMTQRYAHHCVDSLRKGTSALESDYSLTTISPSEVLAKVVTH